MNKKPRIKIGDRVKLFNFDRVYRLKFSKCYLVYNGARFYRLNARKRVIEAL